MTGLITILRLFLLKKIGEISHKKVLFITSTEQSALKYQNDLEKAFGVNAKILPFQNISMYETIAPNGYEFAEQIRVLRERPDYLIAPVKVLLEKFPNEQFFSENCLKIKVGDSIDTKKIGESLIELGYKRSTMVSDIAEFSIRGDIIDIYSLDKKPVRIELWGDEVVDLRYFNNETQKSIEKIKEFEILPVHKFVLNTSNSYSERVSKSVKNNVEDFKNLSSELSEQLQEEGYFEGIDVYQSYFNTDLVSVLDYLKDYVVVYDEASEIFAKIDLLSEGYDKQILENLKLGLHYELKSKNHFTVDEIIQKLASFVKIGFNNFLDEELDEVVEFSTMPLKNFEANLDEITNFIINNSQNNIIIATDYKERVKEILKEREVYKIIEFTDSITSHGGIPKDMSKVEFFNGVSNPRNSVLMRIFLKLGIVEHTGHGIPMIVEKYGKKAFDIHDSYINVIIPFNKNVIETMHQVGKNDDKNDGKNLVNNELTENERRILLELINNQSVPYDQLVSDLKISRRTVSRVFVSLVEKGYIKRIGTNKKGYWKIIK